MMGSTIVLHLLWCMQLMFKTYPWLSLQEACSNTMLLLCIILEIKCWQMSMLLGWLLSDMFLKPLWVSIRKRNPTLIQPYGCPSILQCHSGEGRRRSKQSEIYRRTGGVERKEDWAAGRTGQTRQIGTEEHGSQKNVLQAAQVGPAVWWGRLGAADTWDVQHQGQALQQGLPPAEMPQGHHMSINIQTWESHLSSPLKSDCSLSLCL